MSPCVFQGIRSQKLAKVYIELYHPSMVNIVSDSIELCQANVNKEEATMTHNQ